MAWTARDDDDKKEFFDSPEELDRKVSLLAEMVTSSKHMIAFTVGWCRFSGLNISGFDVVCRELVSARLLEVSDSLHLHRYRIIDMLCV